MPSPPTVSVVIPCFNAERWIAATLRSVLAQQGPTLDVVVVDDGSTDASAELIAKQFPHVRLIRQRNAGVAAARNHGAAECSGHWLAFVDADDIWLPGKLQAQLDLLNTRPDAQVACTDWHVWESSDGEPEADLIERLSAQAPSMAPAGPNGWIYPELLLDCDVWTSTVVVRRTLFEEVGGFDAGLRIGEDLDLWLRLSRLSPIVRVPRPLALYRTHAASITRRAPRENYQGRVIERALSRWGYQSPDGRRANKRQVHRALARTWRDYAGAHLIAGDNTSAMQGAWQALKHDWQQLNSWKLLLRSTVGVLASGRHSQ